MTVRESRERETWARRPEDANSRRTVRGSIARGEKEKKERENGKMKGEQRESERRNRNSSSRRSPRSLLLPFSLSEKKMVAFPALTSAEGLKALDAHLATRSYVEG